MARKNLSKASARALKAAADDKAETPETKGEATVATADGAETPDDSDDTDPDAETDETPETPAAPVVTVAWGQSVERAGLTDEPEARVRERLTAYVDNVLGLPVTQALIDQGWALVQAERSRHVVDKARERLRKMVSSYTFPASLVELVKVAGGEAKASLSLSLDGDKVVMNVVGGAAPRAAGSGGNGGGGRGRSANIAKAAPGVKGGAGKVLWKGVPLTAEMLRTIPELQGSEAYLNQNARGKLMPGRSKPFGDKTNMNAGQALRAFAAEPGRGDLYQHMTLGE